MYFHRRYLGIIFLLICILTIIVAFEKLSGNNISPLESNFSRLKDYMVMGDVFIIDANLGSDCGRPEDWDKLLRAYFPTGLTFIQEPEVQGRRRIWYITGKAQPHEKLQKIVAEGRIPDQSIGTRECLFQLYEAPPDAVGILFENGMRFHGMDVMMGRRPWSAPFALHEGDTIHLRLWWTIDYPVKLDYSVGTYLIKSNGQVYAEFKGFPQIKNPEGAVEETSKWKSGQYYIEERNLTLVYPTPRTRYPLVLDVYLDQVDKRFAAPGVDDKGFLTLQAISVMSY